jgi:hypothetical protein
MLHTIIDDDDDDDDDDDANTPFIIPAGTNRISYQLYIHTYIHAPICYPCMQDPIPNYLPIGYTNILRDLNGCLYSSQDDLKRKRNDSGERKSDLSNN